MSDMRTGFVEPLLAELAGRQHGVVARRQLEALGLKPTAIARRVSAGRLHRVHVGVYAVGHSVLGPDGRRMAAVLACGPGAALSHASAGALWGLRESWAVLTDVTVPRAGGHKRPRLRIHRALDLRADEVTTHRAVPVTTPARTILDLAAILHPAHLENVLDRNESSSSPTTPPSPPWPEPTPATAERQAPGHPRTLRRRPRASPAAASRSSSASSATTTACPRPGSTPRIHGKEVDFLFEAHRLIVETDSWRYHRTRRAFEEDRARDVLTTKAGYRTLRFTDRRLTEDPTSVAAAIHALLADRRAA